jgi:hypothetical protein
VRVFLDENIPRQLRSALRDHEVSSVQSEGWKGKENGELLDLIEGRFDVMLTADGNLPFQQALHGSRLSLVLLPTNALAILRANVAALLVTLEELARLGHPAIVLIDWKGRRWMRQLGQSSADEIELDSVPPFTR